MTSPKMDLTGKTLGKRYLIQKKLAEGGMGNVYAALDLARQNALVAIKVLKSTSHSLKDIIRFQSEFDTLSTLNHPNIVKIHDHGGAGDSYRLSGHYIVMEYLCGQSLAEHLKTNLRFSLQQVIAILTQLCSALACIHARNIIHADLKPSNIILETDGIKGHRVKLIDFGLARLKDFNQVNKAEEIIGTFHYMPPEQSGMIRHAIDERSDLYSLGIIFYELLTGTLPFKSDSLTGLLHQQIAKIPVRPSEYNPEIPPVLDDIISLLLEKEPENRYQGITGLILDLERFSKGDDKFQVGLNDHPAKLSFAAPITGVDAELARLRKMLDQTLDGQGAICLIAGEAGIGKTMLVEEFRKQVLGLHAMVIDAKALERETKTPWHLFKDSLAQYLKIFERFETDRKKYISRVLKQKFNYMGSIIMRLNPALEILLGACPALSELDPEKEKQRFYLCIAQFLCFLAEVENGLVIILEDLHWSDTGSLKLIEELANHIAEFPLLLVGTYRHDEAAEGSNLYNTLTALAGTPRFHSLIVKPFHAIHMRRFLTGILHGQPAWGECLSQNLLDKSRGNPLFAREILKHLVTEKILDWKENGWDLDHGQLQRVEIPATIIDMLLKRISRFNSADNEVMQIASVIGKKFNLELLLELVKNGGDQTTIKTIFRILERAEKNQLIERNDADGGEYAFTHDRIRDAFYLKTMPRERKALHKQIAASIEKASLRPDALIFDLAYHVIESGDQVKIIEYAYPAALEALKEFDYEGSLKYLTHVRCALESGGVADDTLPEHPLWLACMQKIGESCLSLGVVDEALGIFYRIFPHMHNRVQKAHIAQQIMLAYFRKCDFNACEQWAQTGLQLLDEPLPLSTSGVWCRTVKEFILHMLYTRLPFLFMRRKGAKADNRYKLIIAIYSNLFWVYTFFNAKKVPATALRMLNVAKRKLGQSKELATSYCQFGLMGIGVPLFSRPKTYFEKAQKLSEQLNDNFGLAQSLGCLGAYALIRCEFPKVIQHCEKSMGILSEIGDFIEFEKSGLFLFTGYYLMSDYKNAERVLNQCQKLIRSIHDELIYVSIGILPYYYIETGQFEKAEAMLEQYSQFQEKTQTWIMYCASMIAFGHLYTETGDITKALSYFDKALELIKKHRFPMHFLHIIHPYRSVALISDYLQKKDQLDKKANNAYLKKIKKSCRKGLFYAKIWFYQSNYALRANAQYLALINKNTSAEKYFELCLASSRKMGKRNEQALTHYLYGLFLKDIGKKDMAWSQLAAAYRIFDEIGLSHYKKRITELLGLENKGGLPFAGLVQEEKTASILKFGKQLSEYHDFEQLTDIILSKALEITGAQGGGLFLCGDDVSDRLKLSASKSICDETTLDYSNTIVQRAFELGQIIMTTSAQDDQAYATHQSVARYGLKSILCIPLKHNDLINGVCYLHNPLVRGVFTDENARLLGLFLSYGAIAIENALLTEKLTKASEPSGIRIDGPIEKKITRALDYINENYPNKISREHLAKKLALEPQYFGRAFKAHTGRSIRDHVNELRINKSLDKILKADEKIIDIAFSVGFESLRTFNRIFYQVMGETPSRIRDRYKKL